MKNEKTKKSSLEEEVKVELTKNSVIKELSNLGIDALGKKHGFGILVEEDRVKVYNKNGDMCLADKFIGKDINAVEYAQWVINLIIEQLGLK